MITSVAVLVNTCIKIYQEMGEGRCQKEEKDGLEGTSREDISSQPFCEPPPKIPLREYLYHAYKGRGFWQSVKFSIIGSPYNACFEWVRVCVRITFTISAFIGGISGNKSVSGPHFARAQSTRNPAQYPHRKHIGCKFPQILHSHKVPLARTHASRQNSTNCRNTCPL